MKYIGFHPRIAFLILGIALLVCGCGRQETGQSDTSSSQEPYTYQSGSTSVLVPEADGSVTVGGDPLTLDFSHADQGYFTGLLTEDLKVNLQVTGPDNVIYKYFLDTPDTLTSFPFTAGSGNYIVLAFENVGGDQYASLFSYSLKVELANEFLPFLYPNQYVWFTGESEAVRLAEELSADAATDLDALDLIYEYVITHITYDDEKAATVETGYLPDIDETLSSGTGICFDYAALTCAMLRALSIPARLNIGYSGDVRHAWIDVYIQSIGWVEKAVEFKGNEWNLLDPTFASALDEQTAADYIGNGDNYILQYVR
jgi:transglutaminase-like putative cysteine protease